jgi:hypothetical protein
MKKHIIILENFTDEIDKHIESVKKWLFAQDDYNNFLNLKTIIEKEDFNFIVFSDNTSIDSIRIFLSENEIGYNSQLYFVLHRSALGEDNSIKKFKNIFNTNNVIEQSHTIGDFYYECMPQLININCDLAFDELIQPYFIDEELEEAIKKSIDCSENNYAILDNYIAELKKKLQ